MNQNCTLIKVINDREQTIVPGCTYDRIKIDLINLVGYVNEFDRNVFVEPFGKYLYTI